MNLPRAIKDYVRALLQIEQADAQNWKRTGDIDHPHALTVRGALTGTNIHNQTAAGNITSGTYTPTLTNVANLDGSTAYACQYLRVGSVVTVSGRVDVNPTATTDTQLGISLPVASNLGAAEDLGGVGAATGYTEVGGVYADTTNDRAELKFVAASTADHAAFFTFTYRII